MSTSRSSMSLALLLLLSMRIAGQTSPPLYFSSRLKVVSPALDNVYSTPVIPITVKLDTLGEPVTDADKEHDMIHFSLKTAAEGGYDENLDEDLLMHLLPSVNLRLCFHVKNEPLYYCARDYVNSAETTGGSLFRPAPGPHTVYAWLMTVGADDNGGEYVYSNGCSYDEMDSLVCDPFFITEVGTVQAYTYSTFFVKPSDLGGGEDDAEGEAKMSGGAPALSRSAKSPGMGTFTREDRMKYFDKIYEAEVWSFPDWEGGSTSGLGVKSGFGSTLHQTAQIRPYLDTVIDSYGIKAVVDVPCGDMHWIPHVKAIGDSDFCYFGGDVSQVMIEEQREKFSHVDSMRFDVVDVISDGLAGVEGVSETLSCALRQGGSALLFMRHLQFHLTIEENLSVLHHIEFISNNSAVKYVMLSTYLRGNENDEDYLLASGHKINLFKWPYCLHDPLQLVKDGDFDLYMGLWELKPGVSIRRKRNNVERACGDE